MKSNVSLKICCCVGCFKAEKGNVNGDDSVIRQAKTGVHYISYKSFGENVHYFGEIYN